MFRCLAIARSKISTGDEGFLGNITDNRIYLLRRRHGYPLERESNEIIISFAAVDQKLFREDCFMDPLSALAGHHTATFQATLAVRALDRSLG